MIIVTSPNGVQTTYNLGRWVKFFDQCNKLYDSDPDKNGTIIAILPKDYQIDWGGGTDVKHYGKPPKISLDAALGIVEASIESYDNWHHKGILKSIKNKLRRFDARSRCWKK